MEQIKDKSKTIAYARTSTRKQDLGLDVQLKAFEQYQPNQIIKEQISGRKEEREGLNQVLKMLKRGDCLLIYKLDRLSRSTKQLVNLMAELNDNGIQLLSISDGLDTSTTNGRFLFTIMSGLAQMEAEMISKRTKDALAMTDKKLGRPKIDTKIQKRVSELYMNPSLSTKDIADRCNISIRTVYRIAKSRNLSRR
ncbi:recombinase family protein [Latilactobacillus sp. 5-91]|uniref:recombinase family protein n=1 Tax=Latilactobacillus sp. 5-91 TaxID=3410924 RepID=UPI003C75322E